MRKIGIIGYGVQGSFYGRLLLEQKRVNGLTVGAFCDTDPSRRELAKKNYPQIPVYEKAQDLIISGCCDFVIVAVPHYQHPEIVMLAISKGMPVITEKPAGVFTIQVREMNCFAEAHPDVPFGIMLNKRANPIFRRLHDITSSGDMGELRQVVWTSRQFRTQQYYDSSTWRATWGGEGGGVLVNQAPHQIDILQWVFGMPKRVTAVCNTGFRRNIAVENDVCAQFQYANGATGVFITCTHDILGDDTLTAVFDRGRIRVTDSACMTIETLFDSENRLGTEYPQEELTRLRKDNKLVTISTMENKPDEFLGVEHACLLQAFVEHLDTGTPVIAEGTSGIGGVELANAISLSGWLGQPVDLPLDDEKYLMELNKRIEEEGKFTSQPAGNTRRCVNE